MHTIAAKDAIVLQLGSFAPLLFAAPDARAATVTNIPRMQLISNMHAMMRF